MELSKPQDKKLPKIIKDKLTRKFLAYPLNILYVFGLWRRYNNPFLYFIYSFSILFFTQYAYAIFQIVYMIMAWGDIEKIAEASFLLLTQATLCIKIILFFWKKPRIEKVIEYMDEEVFFPKKDPQWLIIDRSVLRQRIEYFLFVFMSSFTIALWAIFPLIDSAPEERLLPFKAWYPLPIETTPYYELLYFYQISGIWFSAMINISIDRLSTAMTANGCAQIEILMDNLLNIEEYAKDDIEEEIKSNIEKLEKNNVKQFPYISDLKHLNYRRPDTLFQYRLYHNEKIGYRLNKCVQHHQNIVKFVKEVESNFHWGVFAQFSASVGIICITGLQITLINPASLKFASKILYLMAMLAQIFFICRIGNDISTISSDLTEAAYCSPWVERERRFKTTLLIFMERLKQPIITRAGNFFPLSLQTFVTILRSSYSYFAVLQQLNSK